MSLDALSLTGIGLSGATLAGVAGPWLVSSWLRHRPRADGPPPAAVVLVLGLLALPIAAAALLPAGLEPAAWAIALGGPMLGVAVSRAWPIALWSARLALPALAVVAALTVRPPGGWLLGVVTAAVAALSWRREIRLSVSPLTPQPAAATPIPPELVPPPILEAAGYDEDGRPEGGS